jgi:hypothetical protein
MSGDSATIPPWRVAARVEPKLGRHCNGGGRILPLRRDVLD